MEIISECVEEKRPKTILTEKLRERQPDMTMPLSCLFARGLQREMSSMLANQ
jgi:hypothetical protein